MARTKGAKNIRSINTIEPSRCKHCGSTKRTDYDNKREVQVGGEHNGHPYTHVVYRSTRCLTCNQCRVDRTFEYEPPTNQL